MKGTIIYQSLPFVHPNAATRSDGFKSVFADFPDVEIVELTGTSVEEHYYAGKTLADYMAGEIS